MAIPAEKIYRPVTGEEAIDLILNEFHKQLVNSGIFPVHRVWHEFEIQGGVRVKGWSTKTEEVKFEITSALAGIPVPEGAVEVQERVDVRIAPQPPSILRESLPEFPCPKCGRVFRSKPAQNTHTTVWCKAEAKPVPTFAETSATFREHAKDMDTRLSALKDSLSEAEIHEPDSSLPPAA